MSFLSLAQLVLAVAITYAFDRYVFTPVVRALRIIPPYAPPILTVTAGIFYLQSPDATLWDHLRTLQVIIALTLAARAAVFIGQVILANTGTSSDYADGEQKFACASCGATFTNAGAACPYC